jgi:hypothetical protein
LSRLTALCIALLCCAGASAETVFFTHRIGGPRPPAKSLSVAAPGSGTARVLANAVVVAPAGGSWLAVTPNETIAPAAIRVSVNPDGLSAGQYTGFISLTAGTGVSGARQVPVTLTVTAAQNTSRIVLSPDSLNFSRLQPDPNSQLAALGAFVRVSSDLPTSTTFVTSSSVSWLSASPSFTAESPLSVIVDTRGLPAGLYNGIVTVAAEDNSAFAILRVSVRIYTAQFMLDATKLDFSYAPGAGPVPAKEIHAESAADDPNVLSTDFRFTPSISSPSGNWILVSQSSSSTPSTLNIQVAPDGLKPGTHMAVMILRAEDDVAEAVAITISLTVTAQLSFSSQVLSVSRNVMRFGGANPVPQPLYAGGASAARYASSILVASGNKWLSATPAEGVLPATISVTASTAGLSEEIDFGFLTISPGDGSSVQSVLVMLTLPRTSPAFFCDVTTGICVVPTPGPPQRLASADQLSFTQGGLVDAPAPQTLSIADISFRSSAPAKYKAEARIATPQGGNWLTISPETGNLPALMNISVNSDGLSPGSYVGFIEVSDPDSSNSLVTVAVLLTVSDPGTTGEP